MDAKNCALIPETSVHVAITSRFSTNKIDCSPIIKCREKMSLGNASGNKFVSGQFLIIMLLDSISQKLCQSIDTCQLPPLVRTLCGHWSLGFEPNAQLRLRSRVRHQLAFRAKHMQKAARFKTVRGKNSHKLSSNVNC